MRARERLRQSWVRIDMARSLVIEVREAHGRDGTFPVTDSELAHVERRLTDWHRRLRHRLQDFDECNGM